MTTKRLGRPPKPPAEKASARITVNATAEQRASWADRAAFEGMSLSSWLAYRADLPERAYLERDYQRGVKAAADAVAGLMRAKVQEESE